jgi:hypothetical protein
MSDKVVAEKTMLTAAYAERNPKTPQGIERIRRAKTKHGLYSKAVREEERRFRTQFRSLRALLREYRASERGSAE